MIYNNMISVKNVVNEVLKKIDSKEFFDFYNFIFLLFVPKKGQQLDIPIVIAYDKLLFAKFKLTTEFTEFLEVCEVLIIDYIHNNICFIINYLYMIYFLEKENN